MRLIGAIGIAVMLIAFGTALANQNNPPNPPEIEGAASGEIGEVYQYNITITDPDGDDMQQLEVDFGDGVVTLYECGCSSRLWESGKTLELFHTWKKSGNYVIKARVMDVHMAWSEWGSMEVSMPKSYSISPWEKVIRVIEHILGRDILPGIFNV